MVCIHVEGYLCAWKQAAVGGGLMFVCLIPTAVFNLNATIMKKLCTKLLDLYSHYTGHRVVSDPLDHYGYGEVHTLAMTGYRQLESYTCGVVAGAMVLHTFHPRRSLEKFFELCDADYDQGLDTKPLIRSLRASGVGVKEHKDLTFAKIVNSLDNGYPIITLVKTSDPKVDHWVVLYGYGKNPDRLFLAGEGVPLVDNILGGKERYWQNFSSMEWAEQGFGLQCWGK